MRKVWQIKLIRPVWPCLYVRSYHLVLCPVTEPSSGVPGQAGELTGHPHPDGEAQVKLAVLDTRSPKSHPWTLAMGKVPWKGSGTAAYILPVGHADAQSRSSRERWGGGLWKTPFILLNSAKLAWPQAPFHEVTVNVSQNKSSRGSFYVGTPCFILIIKGSGTSCDKEGCLSLTLGFLNYQTTFKKWSGQAEHNEGAAKILHLHFKEKLSPSHLAGPSGKQRHTIAWGRARIRLESCYKKAAG